MRAVVYGRPESFEIREVEVPSPGPGEVLIRVLVAGICGTDLHLHAGAFGPSYPLTPGHEFTGEVVAAGDAEGQPLIGHRVAVDNTATCGSCVECRRARPAFCRALVAQGVNAPGGFADYVITDARRCFVADDLDPEVAVLAEPVACVVHGLDVLAPRTGDDVLLFGAGPTGLILTSLLSRSGVSRLVVAAPTEDKLALARDRGADQTVRLDRSVSPAETSELTELTEDGFDIVIDATGAITVLESTLGLTRIGGTVFVYGMARESGRWPVSPYDVFRRELTIKGSFAQQFSFDRAIAALRNGHVDTAGLITHRFGLADYGQALAALSAREVVKAVIVPD